MVNYLKNIKRLMILNIMLIFISMQVKVRIVLNLDLHKILNKIISILVISNFMQLQTLIEML
jgi:hypothetical protein